MGVATQSDVYSGFFITNACLLLIAIELIGLALAVYSFRYNPFHFIGLDGARLMRTPQAQKEVKP